MNIYTDYDGRKIHLTNERLEHILEHVEMQDMISGINLAFSEPDMVIRSISDDSVRLYYHHEMNTLFGEKWLCVVVKEKEDNSFVITAYLTDKPKKGVQIWCKG